MHDHDLTVSGIAHPNRHALTTFAVDEAVMIFVKADGRAFTLMHADSNATNADRYVVCQSRSYNRNTGRGYQSNGESTHSESSN